MLIASSKWEEPVYYETFYTIGADNVEGENYEMSQNNPNNHIKNK